MKTGIFGGSFNPIHIGHLIMAEFGISDFGLDRIIFIPSGHHPFDKKSINIDANKRYEMVVSAIKNNNRFLISDIEIEKNGISYSVDTVKELKERYPNDDFYFMIGDDIILEMEKWHKLKELGKLCKFLLFKRELNEEKIINQKIVNLQEQFSLDIITVNSPFISLSSTDIRSRLAGGKSVRYFVPDAVLDLIKTNSLYTEEYYE